jgi:glycosyltransferase involved in cell wall biosynthesis
MNILFVVFHFPPISGGGVIVAVDIANSLAKIGHDVSVLTPNLEWGGPKYEPEVDSKVDIIRVNVPSKNNLKVAARRCKSPLIEKGIELGRNKKFDFIFTIFHPFHMAPNAAVSIGEKLGIPVIVKIDDAVYEKSTGLKSIQRKVEKILSAKTLNKSSKILVANNETKEIVNEFYDVSPEKIEIMPNGIDTKIFHTNVVKKSKMILFSGVMYNHRGIDVLLNAAPTVIKKIPEVKFVLLGDGPELDNLKKIAENLKIEKNIEFKGWIKRDEVMNYLADASIAIGPLRSTTVTKNALPIKVLEYMASSLPILSQKDTLANDVLVDDENGYSVTDSEDLATKIIHILENNEKRIKMGTKSYEMSLKFDWENVAKKILTEYDDVKF